jgi:hydrogenase maturation protein HypF
VWDGTGYGDDGTVWGGEPLLADAKGFKRVGHLRPFRLIGGEKAVKEPRRVALALLFELFSLEEVLKLDSPAVSAFRVSEIKMLHRAWERGINAPLTSSMGRLFDAVASLAGLRQQVTYEGESGLYLEAAAHMQSGADETVFEVRDGVIDWEPLVRRLLAGQTAEAGTLLLGGLARTIAQIARQWPDKPVILTGGVFQNRSLCEAALMHLEGRKVLLPRALPPNDGAIAPGQLWYALHAGAF